METQAKVRDFTPSSEAADDAYKKGDYETALKHYEALGEDGDSRASMAAGLIHAEGVGDIEVDNAKAVAWLKRSGDQGETVGAELYENIDEKEELSEDEKLKAENLIREFQASDAKLMKDQKTSPTKSISSGNYSSISGTGLPQYSSKSEFVQISEVNSYTVSNDIGASFSPTRSNSGDYSYQPQKTIPSHYLPERE